MPEPVLLAVRLDERDALLGSAGEPQVADRLRVHREEPAGRAVLGRHVPERRAVGDGEPLEPMPVVLDELPDDTGLAQDLRHGEHEIGRGRTLGQRAHELEADDLRDEHRDRLAEHRRLGLDPADSPAEHAEPVDHRRVRVRPDERVGEGDAAAVLDHPREELEVDLVHDPGARRDDLEVGEGALPPAQERVALSVALELELRVPEDREARRELVHLDRVVDDELGGELRVDLHRIAAEIPHGVSHGREVHDRGDAGEVLQQDATGRERDLLRGLGRRYPGRDCLDVVRGDVRAVLVPQHVLEQDAQRVGQAVHVEPLLERSNAKDLVSRSAELELRACTERIGMTHGSIQPDVSGRAPVGL